MISVVTAYYNRKKIFIRTLNSMKYCYGKVDFEVIVVDDASDEEERLEDLVDEFPFLKIIRLEKKNKWYVNPCIPFNIGFKKAKGDKIIIQNPECLHYGDILEYVEDNLENGTYLSFSCFSLDKSSTDNLDEHLKKRHIPEIIESNNHIIKYDGDAGWYNHSFFRPEAFHFCSAITKEDLNELGGFDETFSLGIGYDDNEFVYRVKKMGIFVEFVDSMIVLHQNHYEDISLEGHVNKYKSELVEKNKKIFQIYTPKIKKGKLKDVGGLFKGSFKSVYIKIRISMIFKVYRTKMLLKIGYNNLNRLFTMSNYC